MKKLKRKKNIRGFLQAKLDKYERRIQRISEESYKLRQMIKQFDDANKPAEIAVAPTPIEPKETTDAVLEQKA